MSKLWSRKILGKETLIGTPSIKKINVDNSTFIFDIHGTNIYTLVVLLLDQLPFKNDTKHTSKVIVKKIPGSSLQMLFHGTWDQISTPNSVLKRTLSQTFDHTVIISWLHVQPHGMCSHVNLKSRHMPSSSSSSSSISSYFSFPGNMTPESHNSKSITFHTNWSI